MLPPHLPPAASRYQEYSIPPEPWAMCRQFQPESDLKGALWSSVRSVFYESRSRTTCSRVIALSGVSLSSRLPPVGESVSAFLAFPAWVHTVPNPTQGASTTEPKHHAKVKQSNDCSEGAKDYSMDVGGGLLRLKRQRERRCGGGSSDGHDHGAWCNSILFVSTVE